jgi:glutamate-5-semialdehyde dehydrogenase
MMSAVGKKAKLATLSLLADPSDQGETARVQALAAIVQALSTHEQKILKANAKDVALAKKNKLAKSLVDRLTLSHDRMKALRQSVTEVAAWPLVVGEVVENFLRPNGLTVKRQRVPIGVFCLIFESRPNVIVEAAALAIKSGNALILKGGSEAGNSNQILVKIIQQAIAAFLPKDSLQLVSSRRHVDELLKLHQYIDMVVPRGGEKLVKHVKAKATMPVVAHDKGLCHVYAHADADAKMLIPILLNSKVARPGVCNAAETFLWHEDLNPDLLKKLFLSLHDAGVEIRGCPSTKKIWPKAKRATIKDFQTEYLDKIISVKKVKNLDRAILHIQTYGSHHTEVILTLSPKAALEFQNRIDASCIVVNASSRFNDGGELGLGAELGISTSKVHAYGAMGVREMTIVRTIVEGHGQTR